VSCPLILSTSCSSRLRTCTTRRPGYKSNKELVMIEEDPMLTKNMESHSILKEIAQK
jgi:hypothetical protein